MITISDDNNTHATVDSGSVVQPEAASADGPADGNDTQTTQPENDPVDGDDAAGRTAPVACAPADFDMNFVANVVKKSMMGVLGCMCCCFPLMNATNICAIVFAFVEYERGECPGEDICSVECQDDAFMSMTHFLLVAGAGALALSVSGMMALTVFIRSFTETVDLAVQEGSKTERFTRQADGVKRIQLYVKLFAAIPSMLLQMGWGTAGIILYTQVNQTCKDTGEAKMVLAWCCITLCMACSQCNQIMKPVDLDDAFSKLFAVGDAADAAL